MMDRQRGSQTAVEGSQIPLVQITAVSTLERSNVPTFKRTSRGQLRDTAAIVLLCLSVIACTWQIALAGRVLAGGDIFTYFYPYWVEATRAIRAARLPLWNPTLFMGVPLVANSQVGFFYPLNWPLWLLLPAHRSVHVTIVLHLCLAALNAYVWGRRSLGLGRVASWTVGAVFALGGYMGAQVEHVNQLQGLAWLPLMLMLSDRVVGPPLTPPRGRGIRVDGRYRPGTCAPRIRPLLRRLKVSCAFAVVVALVLLAGHTQTAFISLFGVAVYGLAPMVWRSLGGGGWKPASRLALGATLLGVGTILGVVLAAIQLLPTWELSQLSVRAQGLPFNERVSFSLSPVYVGRALLPAFGGAISPDHLEHVAYVGTTGLALALVALLTDLQGLRSSRQRLDRRRREEQQSPPMSADRGCRFSRFASFASLSHGGGFAESEGRVVRDLVRHRAVYAIILLGLFFALGLYNPLYVLLARYVPGFAHFRVPARWLALYGSGIAALAGRAVQALWERRSPDGRHVLIVAGSLAVLVLWAIVGSTKPNALGLSLQASTWLGGRCSEGFTCGLFAGQNLDLLSVIGWVVTALGSTGLLLVASRSPRVATVGLLALLMGELFLASRALPRARATAPQAFTSMRPAVAHLLASEGPEAAARGSWACREQRGSLAAPQGRRGHRPSPNPSQGEGNLGRRAISPRHLGRFLSMSDTTFDPGDLSLIEGIYGPQLSNDQLYDFIVATKQKELLSPNLPLAFGVPAVDGYDGGLLPLQRYVMLQRAFLPSEDVSIDGRLRENLSTIPAGRWLSLFNVRYVITDKLEDVWIDDVFYDLQFGARLSQGEAADLAEVPGFEATALGVVSHLEQEGTQSPQIPEPTALGDEGVVSPGDAPIGVVRVGFADGEVRSFELRAGNVPESAGDEPAGTSMVTRLRWPEPGRPLSVTLEAIAPGGVWVVRGISLIDERTGSFQSLVISDRGRFRLAHSGDVKIYENLDVLPRAFIVPQAQVVSDDEAALRVMKDTTFDLSSQVVLSGDGASCEGPKQDPAPVPGGGVGRTQVLPETASGSIKPRPSPNPSQGEGNPDALGHSPQGQSASATVTMYRPERVVIEAALDYPGYLVLTDAHYPGWHAMVDGERVPMCRADLLFRAVALEPGEHRVILTFRPALQRLGAAVSIVGLVVLVMVWFDAASLIVESGVRCYNGMQG